MKSITKIALKAGIITSIGIVTTIMGYSRITYGDTKKYLAELAKKEDLTSALSEASKISKNTPIIFSHMQ